MRRALVAALCAVAAHAQFSPRPVGVVSTFTSATANYAAGAGSAGVTHSLAYIASFRCQDGTTKETLPYATMTGTATDATHFTIAFDPAPANAGTCWATGLSSSSLAGSFRIGSIALPTEGSRADGLISAGSMTWNGVADPIVNFGYNMRPNFTTGNGVEPGLGFQVEGHYDDLSGVVKMESYGQWLSPDGSTYRRWIMTQLAKETGLPNETLLSGNPVTLRVNDGTGDENEQIVGKIKLIVNATNSQFKNNLMVDGLLYVGDPAASGKTLVMRGTAGQVSSILFEEDGRHPFNLLYDGSPASPGNTLSIMTTATPDTGYPATPVMRFTQAAEVFLPALQPPSTYFLCLDSSGKVVTSAAVCGATLNVDTVTGHPPGLFAGGYMTWNSVNVPMVSWGYNLKPNFTTIDNAEPALGWQIEGHYDDLSGTVKMETFSQWLSGNGSVSRRWIGTQLAKATGLPTESYLTGGSSVALRLNDGTGTSQEQTTGKLAVLATPTGTEILKNLYADELLYVGTASGPGKSIVMRGAAGQSSTILFEEAGSHPFSLTYDGSAANPGNKLRIMTKAAPDSSYPDTVAAEFGQDGSVLFPAVKSTTGNRYVCVDSTGKLISSATACSGT